MSDGTTELIKPAPVLGARWRRKRIRIDPEAHEIHFDLMEAKAAATPALRGGRSVDLRPAVVRPAASAFRPGPGADPGGDAAG